MAEEKSKFAAFIAEKKIDPRRIIAASRKLEKLQPADRASKLAQRQQRAQEGGEKKEIAKPRSGRPVTPRALELALAGGSLTGPQKTRFVRAVNHILEQKKADAAELKTLF